MEDRKNIPTPILREIDSEIKGLSAARRPWLRSMVAGWPALGDNEEMEPKGKAMRSLVFLFIIGWTLPTVVADRCWAQTTQRIRTSSKEYGSSVRAGILSARPNQIQVGTTIHGAFGVTEWSPAGSQLWKRIRIEPAPRRWGDRARHFPAQPLRRSRQNGYRTSVQCETAGLQSL
jgi:hypothetical protein